MASRRPTHVWLLAALLCATPVACLFSAEVPPGPCKADPEACDDGNPCTADSCQPNGFCNNEPDDGLVPDDGNPCTTDKCVSGEAQNTSVPDGTGCGLNNQLQCENGSCKCKLASECGVDEDCLKFACEMEACKTTNVAEGTVINGGEPEDCRQNACDGAGKLASVPDLMDFPADSMTGDCNKKGCSAEGTVISVIEKNDVPPDDNPGDCKKPSCSDAGTVTEIPDITDIPTQNPAADCKKPGCDPNGNPIDIEDTSDAPLNDNNPCTDEGCNGMTPINYVPVANDTPCGDVASCGPNGTEYSQTSAETCQNGICAAPVTDSCGTYICNGTVCHVGCMSNAQCAPGASCQGGLCKPQIGLGTACVNAGDCVSGFCVDGVCCNAACDTLCRSCVIVGQLGICGSIAAGTDPDAECAGTEVCDGAGGCKKANGAACGGDAECLTGQCEDGVCCNADCAGDCKKCDITGSVGTCTNVTSGQTAGACTGNNVCNGSGSCVKVNGQTCASNGECLSNACVNEGGGNLICCNNSCNGTCKSCLASKTGGLNGVCDNITTNTNPDNECMMGQVCNGAGACKKVNGQSCSNASDCLSGFCPSESGQDVCCATACTGVCTSCKAMYTGGMDGTCGFVNDKTDPNDDCTGTCDMMSGQNCCDGAGACK